LAKVLIVVGLLIAAIGALSVLGAPVGRLPGDFSYRRGNFAFFFPLGTSILVSVILTLVFFFLRR